MDHLTNDDTFINISNIRASPEIPYWVDQKENHQWQAFENYIKYDEMPMKQLK